MYGLLTALVYCVTLLVILERARALADRLVAIAERRAEPAPRQEAVSLPQDLYAVAQSYDDEWAREQAMQSMREMYGESGSWDVVRVRFGLAQQDNA